MRPPKGSEVAIVVFEDLQCPQCRRVAPILEQASKTYKIPLVRHDFPLPMHNWSYQAAVMARYFDETSKALGNEFRDYIFSNQLEINPQNLRGYADKCASEHKVALPFVIELLHSVFKKQLADAFRFAEAIRKEGKSDCGSYPRDIATLFGGSIASLEEVKEKVGGKIVVMSGFGNPALTSLIEAIG